MKTKMKVDPMAAALGNRGFGPGGAGSPNVAAVLARISLSKTERAICEKLARSFGQWIPTERLLTDIYRNDPDGGPLNAANVIAVTCLNMRGKLAAYNLAVEGSAGSGRRIVWTGEPPAIVETVFDAPTIAPRPKAIASIDRPKLRPGDIEVGEIETGGVLGLDLSKLIDGRLMIQGASGAGKSWTLRRLIEQTHGEIQQIIVDPEGEFKELASVLGLLHLEGHRLDIATLATAAARAREHRVSLVLDLSELDRDDQMKAITAFFEPLIQAPRSQWHPVLVIVDEAHLFAPFGGFAEATAVRKAAISAVTDLMSRGRKRGIAGVLATQRLARLAKSVASEVHNFLVGLNTLDLDIRRAAETIGWDARKAFDRIPMLAPGEFIAVGSAFSQSPVGVKVGGVQTPHRGAAPQMAAPKKLAPDAAARTINLDELMANSSADQAALDEATLPQGYVAIRSAIRDKSFPDAGRVWGALREMYPSGARVADLAEHLNRSTDQIAAALALLDMYAAVEFTGEGDKRAARCRKEMAQ